MKQKKIIAFLFAVSGILGFSISLFLHSNDQQEQDARPALVGDTRVLQTFHYPASFINQLKGDKEAGRKIFKEFCSACHDPFPKIDIKAPHVDDKNYWQSVSKLGIPALLKITVEGSGAMPARGGCFECSDDQLSETIVYMIHYSQQSF